MSTASLLAYPQAASAPMLLPYDGRMGEIHCEYDYGSGMQYVGSFNYDAVTAKLGQLVQRSPRFSETVAMADPVTLFDATTSPLTDTVGAAGTALVTPIIHAIWRNPTTNNLFSVWYDAAEKYYVYISADGGVNWGANSPAYDDLRPVVRLGEYSGTHYDLISTLRDRSFCDLAGDTYLAEYNANVYSSSGTVNISGSVNRVSRLLKITSTGTVSTVFTSNSTGGAVPQYRHLHCIRAIGTYLVIGLGDAVTQSSTIVWDTTISASWPLGDNFPLANITNGTSSAIDGLFNTAIGYGNGTDYVSAGGDWVVQACDEPNRANMVAGIYRFDITDPQNTHERVMPILVPELYDVVAQTSGKTCSYCVATSDSLIVGEFNNADVLSQSLDWYTAPLSSNGAGGTWKKVGRTFFSNADGIAEPLSLFVDDDDRVVISQTYSCGYIYNDELDNRTHSVICNISADRNYGEPEPLTLSPCYFIDGSYSAANPPANRDGTETDFEKTFMGHSRAKAYINLHGALGHAVRDATYILCNGGEQIINSLRFDTEVKQTNESDSPFSRSRVTVVGEVVGICGAYDRRNANSQARIASRLIDVASDAPRIGLRSWYWPAVSGGATQTWVGITGLTSGKSLSADITNPYTAVGGEVVLGIGMNGWSSDSVARTSQVALYKYDEANDRPGLIVTPTASPSAVYQARLGVADYIYTLASPVTLEAGEKYIVVLAAATANTPQYITMPLINANRGRIAKTTTAISGLSDWSTGSSLGTYDKQICVFAILQANDTADVTISTGGSTGSIIGRIIR
jgi:hypothetical protein